MKILVFLRNLIDCNMTTPVMYGWFHILCIVIGISFTVFLCWKFKDCSDKTLRRILMISFIVMISIETIKQFYYSTSVSDGQLVWNYQWFVFPYQLCSTPIYIFPFTFLLKDGKARDAVMAYMMTFSFFGGVAVFALPDVFTVSTVINIQSMLHHGIQIYTGALLMTYYRKKITYKNILYGCIVFAILFVIAISLNEIVNASGVVGANGVFNMFFINRKYGCHLPLLSLFWGKVPYVVFAMIYFVGFMGIAFLIYGTLKGILALVNKYAKKSEA